MHVSDGDDWGEPSSEGESERDGQKRPLSQGGGPIRREGDAAAASVLAAVAGAAALASAAGLLIGVVVAVLTVPVIAGFRSATGRLRDGVGRALDAIGAAEELGLRKPDIDHFMQIGRRWLRNLRGAFGKQV